MCPLVEASSVAAFSEMKAVEVEYERLQVRMHDATPTGKRKTAAALASLPAMSQ